MTNWIIPAIVCTSAIVLTWAVVALLAEVGSRSPAKTNLLAAKPGLWYGSYNSDWHAAHPGAWVRGEEDPGHFCADDSWGSSTLEWDQEWFSNHDMSMPRKYHFSAPKPPGPNEFRIGRLGPGESIEIPIRFEDES